MNNNNHLLPRKRIPIRLSSLVCLLGLFIFLIGAHPDWFGMDRSPVIGFVQITVFLAGLGLICIGGYLTLSALWEGSPKSILADFGQRLISTGFVIALACGMADIFGFGSEISPTIPYFGFWQMIGVLVGEIVIGAGMIMMIPYQKREVNI